MVTAMGPRGAVDRRGRPGMLPLIGLALVIAAGTVRAADTLRVVTHEAVTVVTDPSTGARRHPRWGVFPPADFEVRRAVMRVTFGCPDSMRCADWDYLDHIVIRRNGGAAAPSLDHEIGRMITPYGGAFTPDWRFSWTADVTDFSLLLRDSVEIDYVHTGYEPDTGRGWKVTVEFEFTGGPPAARPISIVKLLDGRIPYGDTARPVEQALAPWRFRAADGASFARLLVFQTGHGSDDSGCAEFCDRYREILFDGKVADRKQLWKRCGENPLWPQAGTWIYDRANWCPGELVPPDVHDFPVVPGSEHLIGLRMEPHALPGSAAEQAVSVYLIQYAAPRARNDAAVVAVLVPSAEDADARDNPACAGPRVVVRNNGSVPLTELFLRFGTLYFDDRSHSWEGLIPPQSEATIDLPGGIPQRVSGNRYRVRLYAPNAAEDEWPEDNEMIVPFSPTPAFWSPVILHLKANREPEQTSWVLRRGDGSVARESGPGRLAPGELLRDTFRLDPGCYTLEIRDSAGDGLEFWYNTRGGRGYARLLDGSGALLAGFESDFGSRLAYSFRITENPRLRTKPSAEPAIGLFPTRTSGATTLDYFANDSAEVVVRIVADPGGETVQEHRYPGLRTGEFTYDLAARGPQRYYLKVFVDGTLRFNKRVRVVGMSEGKQ